MAYELQSVNLPTLTGNALRLFVKALRDNVERQHGCARST